MVKNRKISVAEIVSHLLGQSSFLKWAQAAQKAAMSNGIQGKNN
jgi:hypothetical protein